MNNMVEEMVNTCTLDHEINEGQLDNWTRSVYISLFTINPEAYDRPDRNIPDEKANEAQIVQS